jgi:hypothetical protein
MPFTIKRYKTRAKWKKYKSCVGKVESKGTAVNPHAVCRKSVYGTKKNDVPDKFKDLTDHQKMIVYRNFEKQKQLFPAYKKLNIVQFYEGTKNPYK